MISPDHPLAMTSQAVIESSNVFIATASFCSDHSHIWLHSIKIIWGTTIVSWGPEGQVTYLYTNRISLSGSWRAVTLPCDASA